MHKKQLQNISDRHLINDDIIASELSGQPWYVQALGSKLMPMLAKSMEEGKSETVQELGMGLLGKR